MRRSVSYFAIVFSMVLIFGCSTSNKNNKTSVVPATASMPPAGTMAPPTPTGGMPGMAGMAGGAPRADAPKPGPKPFRVFFDSAKVKVQKGLITTIWQDDKYYFEIPASLMGKDILAVTRYTRTAAGANLYGGEQANENVLRFERGPENKVFLRTTLNVVSSPDSTKPIYQAVKNSNVDPIAAAFDIKAYGRERSSVVIDVTDFFKGDNVVVSLSSNAKRNLNLSAIALDRSYIESIQTYPGNTEIRSVKTFSSNPPTPNFGGPSPFPQQRNLPAASATGAVTIEVNTSMIKLPDNPMQRRFFDPRVGYFADQVTEFLDTVQRANRETFIVRWRLEPKPEDIERYKRGELVEPKKQIVYYIDPSTPTKWQPYLIAGINDWNAAFEEAGFKNAIVGKVWPKDSSMSLEGANHSAVRYLASEIANAYGPNVHDPRTGEILESHIGWYHNVMQLLQNWYFVQAAAVDPGARKMKFDDSLMGDLIRFVSSHEVGHTLGLRHNMGSSSKTPVELLRNKEWVEAHGHTASIMDYARFNYVAQPEDHISRKGLYPRIGDYDKWAIKWGYRWTDKSAEQDRKDDNKLIVDNVDKNPRLWFGGEGQGNDPRAQTEDLSDNAMVASEYGIRNLKLITKNLPVWTKEEGDRYQNLAEIYNQVVGQFARYNGHVTKNIGGVNETFKSVEEAGNVYEPVTREMQKSAVVFLNKQTFQTPNWLLDDNILNKISAPVSNNVYNLQSNVLGNVLSPVRLSNMLEAQDRFGAKTYSVTELFSDLKNGIWSELNSGSAISMPRRNLQKTYVDRMIGMLPSAPAPAPGPFGPQVNTRDSDLPSIARGHLNELLAEIRSAITKTNDKLSKYHLQDEASRINLALNPKS